MLRVLSHVVFDNVLA